MTMKLPIAGLSAATAAVMLLFAVLAFKGTNQGVTKPADLRGVRKMQQLVLPTNIGGTVNGEGITSGFTTSEGQAYSSTEDDNTPATSNGNGSTKFDSGASGFVVTIFGGGNGTAASGLSLASEQEIGGSEIGSDDFNFDPTYSSLTGTGNTKGGSVAATAGNFTGVFNPSASKGPVTGTGFGTGSFKVEGGGSIDADGLEDDRDGSGSFLGSGTANIFGGGSATSFNDKVAAGGRGSGASNGTAASDFVVDDDAIRLGTTDAAATGTFTGRGSGNNLPNQGGSAQGSGNGAGTGLVNGYINGDDGQVVSNLDAAFNSNGGGSAFVATPFGGASGSAAGGSSGGAAGEFLSDNFDGVGKTSASSVANGDGAFVSGFTPAGLSGLTGGTTSGIGSLNVTGSASLDTDDDAYRANDFSGVGTAASSGGGQASAFNLFGEAGALGAGMTTGSATGGASNYIPPPLPYVSLTFDAMGAGAATGNFNTGASGSFGQPASLPSP